MSYDGGFGVDFKIGDGPMSGTPTYTTIAQLENIGGVGITAIMDEVTNHASPGGYREKFPSGLFEVDDIEVSLIFDITEATHANATGGLLHAQQNNTKLAYQFVFPDASSTTFTFDAFVSKVMISPEKEKAIRGTATMTITGQPTIS